MSDSTSATPPNEAELFSVSEADRAHYASLYRPPVEVSPLSTQLGHRYEQYHAAGSPVTVWERHYRDNNVTGVRDNSATVLFSPSSFNELRLSRPLDANKQDADGFLAEECRNCTGRFVFRTREHSVVVLIGLPKDKIYKAISYVWGDTVPMIIQCKCYSKKIFIPMSGPERFSALLSLGSTADGYDGVWLDTLSIDQDSHSDRQMLLSKMGEIYKSAMSTLVLFTPADEPLFDCMEELREAACIQDVMDFFDPEVVAEGEPAEWELEVIARFILNLEELKQNLNSGTYFQRAWTFQEWTFPQDLDVTCELTSPSSEQWKLLPKIRSTIVRAAVRLATHAMKRTSYRLPECLPGADAPAFVDEIKILFPHEDVFCSVNESDWDELQLDNIAPATGLNHQLGLRLAGQERTSDQAFRARLHLALNALNTSKRQARYTAGLFACWASMCNLEYDYQRDDTFMEAQKKVLEAIRSRGVRIYNFQANIPGMTAEMDAEFLSYSFSQLHTHTTHKAFSFGAPVFTGVSDFSHHLRSSVCSRETLRMTGLGVELSPVTGVTLEKIIPGLQIERVAEELARIQTGFWEQPFVLFKDTRAVARAALRSLPLSDLQRMSLVVVSFKEANLYSESPIDSEEERYQREEIANTTNYILSLDLLGRSFTPYTADTVPTIEQAPNIEYLKYAWAFCRNSDISSKTIDVAREHLNGTLVLFHRDNDMRARVLAYLTGIDMMAGAYLLPVEPDGEMDITLRAPQQGDIMVAARGLFAADADRQCMASLEFQKLSRRIVAY